MIEKKVSIIIPVYNVEKYLKKCIESILNQTYDNLEVILVNDGSIDSSRDICLHYAQNNDRIVYIEQKNLGPSAARNKGIDKAEGEYIQFIDADDYLPPDSVKKLVEAIDISDFVIAGYYNLTLKYEGIIEKKVNSEWNGLYTKKELLSNWGDLVNKGMFHYTWNKLYKSNVVKNKIKFNEDVKISEDMIFNIDYLSMVNKINIINTPVYYHIYYNHDSLTKKYHSELFEMRKTTNQYITKFLLSNNVYKDGNSRTAKKLFSRHVLSLLVHLVSPENEMNTIEKKHTINTIINDVSVREVLADVDNRFLPKTTAYLIKYKRTNYIYILYTIINYYLQYYVNKKKRFMRRKNEKNRFGYNS